MNASVDADLMASFTDCLRGNHQGCLKRGLPLLSGGGRPTLAGLVLISARHSNRDDIVESLAATLAPRRNKWKTALVRMLLEEMSPEQLLSKARSGAQRTEAHFYAGVMAGSEWDFATAREQLQLCAGLGGDSEQARLARAWLATREPLPFPGGAREMLPCDLHFLIRWANVTLDQHPPLPDAAVLALNKALPLCDSARFPRTYAHVQVQLSLILELRGDLDNAIRRARAALAVLEAIGDRSPQYGETLNTLGLLHRNHGDLNSARAYQERVVDFFERASAAPADRATGLNNLAVICREQGDLEAARTAAERSSDLMSRINPRSDILAVAWNVLGAILEDQGRLDEALPPRERAVAQLKDVAPRSEALVIALDNLGTLLLKRGAHHQAAENLRLALDLAERLDPASLLVAQVLCSAGAVSRQRGDHDGALEKYRRALPLVESLAPQSELACKLLHNIGMAHSHRGETRLALGFFERALATARKHFSGAASTRTLELALAEVIQECGGRDEEVRDWSEIIELYQDALRVPKVLPLGAVPHAHWALASLYARLSDGDADNLRRSVQHFHAALPAIDHWRIRAELAEVHCLRQDWKAADEEFDLAHARFLDRAGGFPVHGWLSETPERATFYPRHAEVCARLGRGDRAFECAARAKARLLAHRLEMADLLPKAAVPPDLVGRLRELRQRMQQHSWQTPEAAPGHDPVAWVQRDRILERLREEEAGVLDEVARLDPAFVSALRGESAGWRAVREVLGAREVLLEFVVSGGATLVMVGTRELEAGPEVLRLDGFGEWELRTLVQGRGVFATPDRPGFLRLYADQRHADWASALKAALDETTAQLFEKPAADGRTLRAVLRDCRLRFGGSLDVRLTIIPHGLLYFIPFHGCPVESGSASRLIDEFVVCYAPSSTMWHQARGRPHKLDRLCAYADPDSTLPGTRAEVQCIQRHFAPENRRLFAPGQVRRENLLAGLTGATVLHAAGHAKHDFDDFRCSALQLSDGPLLLKEILAGVNTEGLALVVLSACETGVTPTTLVDEGLTFAGAFLQAGAKWIVASQWKVEDMATCLLMVRMYELLFAAGGAVTPPEALAGAQRWLRTLTIADGRDYLTSRGASAEAVGSLRHRDMGLAPGANTTSTPAADFHDPFYWAGFYCSGA